MTANLFADLPPAEGISCAAQQVPGRDGASPKGTCCGARSTAPDEQFSELLSRPGLRIERIVSTGQASPPDFWYDQPDGEWVLLVQGEARLRFADEAEPRHLRAGDHLDIAAHRRHRVDWTPPDQATIWLAVHYRA